MSTNTQRAVNRVKDRMRQGGLLMRMHSVHGIKWYLVPRRRGAPGREVPEAIAKLVINEIDVFPGRDGMWPGCDQTWGIGDVATSQ